MPKKTIGQGRAPNTIELRAKYNNHVIDKQSAGKTPLPFQKWAKLNFPNKKILNQR